MFSYTFKGHKKENKDVNKQITYPVNDIAYYPEHSEGESLKLATCGSDGYIRIWDGEK